MGNNLLCALLLCLLCADSAESLTPRDIFRRYAPSVATLVVTKKDGFNGIATGFLVANSELITNYHVVDNAESVAVYFSKDICFSAKRIIAQDPDKDLALLAVENIRPPVPYLGLSQMTLAEGEGLIVIGSPRGLDKTITTGILSAYRQTEKGTTLLQISAPVTTGSSGSPVFEPNGRVIGIISSGVADTQGLNFAVSVKDMLEFIRKRPFKEVAAAGADEQNGDGGAARQKTVAALSDIQAKLNAAKPGTPVAAVLSALGKPDRADPSPKKGNQVWQWNFIDNDAIFVVWTDGTKVERATWAEYYAAEDKASARASSCWELASHQMGKPDSFSQGSRNWKMSGGLFGIERRGSGSSYMVVFKMVR